MACPLFIPGQPMSGIATGTLTLGDLHGGSCAADPALAVPDEILRQCCNPGYARGTCERAVAVESDAVRFLVRVRNFKGVEVAWSLEKDHFPVAVGVVQLASLAESPPEATVLERQARAYARSILWQA